MIDVVGLRKRDRTGHSLLGLPAGDGVAAGWSGLLVAAGLLTFRARDI